MKKSISFVKQYKLYFIIAVLVLAVAGYFIFANGNSKKETYKVEKRNVAQSVVLSGDARTSDRADLGFAASGRIAHIFVKNNQNVKQGSVIAQLEVSDLLADLKIKQTQLAQANVDIDSAKEELDRVRLQEDAKVESAYRKLLSSDLELTPDLNSYDVDAPNISGLYDGPEGQYKVSIEKKNITLPDFTLKTFGLETTSRILNEESSTPLGTKGLYLSFTDSDISPYLDTIWYLNIPNKSGSSYLANYNAYNEAKKSRDLAIQDAETKYKKTLAEGSGGVSSIAQAEVDKINAEIRKNTIYAPFSGKVTNITKEVGENASTGEQVISMVGESKLEIVLKVSELDVSRLVPGAGVKLTFDAIPNETFNGILQTINSRDTEIDGVPVYEAFVDLEADNRIKSGMTATGEINITSKDNVLAIPNYFIKNSNGKNFVKVAYENGKTEEREISIGLLGTDSIVEITYGLNEGETVISQN